MRTVRGRVAGVIALCTVVLLFVVSPSVVTVKGADHRDAPLIDEDPTADIADVYVFVNPNDPDRVVFAMTVNGFAVPAVRNSYSFSQDVLYQFKIDNTGDGREDLVIQARFEGTEPVRDPRCPAMSSGPQAAQGGQFVTILGPAAPSKTGAENKELKKAPALTGCSNLVLGQSPDGVRAFAGLRDDPFVVDIAQFFRILGGAQDVFRGFTSPALGPLAGRPIRPDGTSGVDSFGGFNASALVVEVPKALIRGTAGRQRTYLGNGSTIGVWGTTSRQKDTRLSTKKEPKEHGDFIQIQRMGHQVVKTVFIPAAVRDFFNREIPEHDVANFRQFIPDALTTEDNDGTGNTIGGRAAVLDAVGVTALPNGAPLLLPPGFPNTNRNLLRNVLLPDVLRINLSLAPDALAIGANGYQNGRRLEDDVIDIVLRLARQLADVKFPDGSGLPGSGPVGDRKPLDCSVLPACPDRRVLAVLQGTDFIKPDATVEGLAFNGNDRPVLADFPFFGPPHPFPGSPGTTGFPPQQ